MATLKDIIKEGKIYVCDECKKEFPAKNVKLEDAVDNIKILTPLMPFVYLDKNGKMMGGTEQAKKDLGDKLLCCPHCGQTHLYGFSVK